METDPNMQKYLEIVLTAVQSSNWKAVAALAIIFLIFLLRKVATKIPAPVGPWLRSDRGGVVCVLVMSSAGAIATALLAGHKLSFNLVATGLITGTMASGMRDMMWNLIAPKDKPKKEKKKKDEPKPEEKPAEEKPAEEKPSEEKKEEPK